MLKYVISASLGTGIYRHIEISSEATLLELHQAILGAYNLNAARAPWFMPKRQKQGERLKYSLNRTRTTIPMREARLKDTVFSTKGYMTHTIQEPGYEFNCRTLKMLHSDDPKTKVVAGAGSHIWYFKGAARWRLAAELALREAEKGIAEAEVEMMLRYIIAAGNLYGIIPLDTLHRFYCEHQPAISPHFFEEVALVVGTEEDTRVYLADARGQLLTQKNARDLKAEYLVDYTIIDGDAFHEVLREQTGKPFYRPSEEELLRYVDDDYQEHTPQYLGLRQRLKQLGVPQRALDEVMFMLVSRIQGGQPETDDLFNVLDQFGIMLSGRGAVNRLLGLYTDMNNNTRTHFNRGHTPEEMYFLMSAGRRGAKRPPFAEAEPADALPLPANAAPPNLITLADYRPGASSPGRNAPCPCGSGKKYKRCCGAADNKQ